MLETEGCWGLRPPGILLLSIPGIGARKTDALPLGRLISVACLEYSLAGFGTFSWWDSSTRPWQSGSAGVVPRVPGRKFRGLR